MAIVLRFIVSTDGKSRLIVGRARRTRLKSAQPSERFQRSLSRMIFIARLHAGLIGSTWLTHRNVIGNGMANGEISGCGLI
ncbi:hypothetical protein [Bradyrhizobium symbiodeficiens]|uniref:Uncharacterized protein n=1 Tax=Bradyrhizobium symbiodeficiens TaxID=1404367 RepID=A0AAJ6ML51_9BRAD